MILCTTCNGTGYSPYVPQTPGLWYPEDCPTCGGRGEVFYRDERGRFAREPRSKDPRFA